MYKVWLLAPNPKPGNMVGPTNAKFVKLGPGRRQANARHFCRLALHLAGALPRQGERKGGETLGARHLTA